MVFPAVRPVYGRTPPGVRGLKYATAQLIGGVNRRTPPGVRGLKFRMDPRGRLDVRVAPHPGCVD